MTSCNLFLHIQYLLETFWQIDKLWLLAYWIVVEVWTSEKMWQFDLLKRCGNLTYKQTNMQHYRLIFSAIFFCELVGVNKCLNILFWSNPALAVPTDKMRICFRDRFWYSWPYCYQWIHKLLQINRTKNGNSNKFKLVGEFSLKQYFYFGVYMMILYL